MVLAEKSSTQQKWPAPDETVTVIKGRDKKGIKSGTERANQKLMRNTLLVLSQTFPHFIWKKNAGFSFQWRLTSIVYAHILSGTQPSDTQAGPYLECIEYVMTF